MSGVQVTRNRFDAIRDNLRRSAERIPQYDVLQNMQSIDRLAEAVAGSVRKSRVPVHDTRVVVWVNVDCRGIPHERVVLGGELERRIDISIRSSEPNESRIEVGGW